MRRDARYLQFGAGGSPDDAVSITPESAEWDYTGLRVVELGAGETRQVTTADFEMLVLPLSGSCSVSIGEKRFDLNGRRSVFENVTDFLYLPIGTNVSISSRSGGSFALPMARAEKYFPPAYYSADDVSIEIRGAGSATRQLNNFFAPSYGSAERLVAVEVLTPGGNTSSYPPHKHDVSIPNGEAELEEIYYFRFNPPEGFGLHRTYAADGSFDVTATVHDGDVFLVPSGYHGPCVALPGYDMYYLNVLAGPASQRSLAFSDDPHHAWIRKSWSDQKTDPRLPMTSARGPVR